MDRSKIRLGVFILSGVALFILGLLALGLSSMFTTKAHLVTAFDESVQGLSKGSTIKYKGVPIGSVSNIAILIESKIIMVEMDVELIPFRNNNYCQLTSDPQQLYSCFKGEIERGLRCRLEYAGITGLKYIELDYFAQPGAPYAQVAGLKNQNDFFVPSSPSALRDVLRSVNTSLEKISKIDFDKMASSVTGSLTHVQRLLSDPALQGTIEHTERIAQRLDETITRFNKAFTGERLDNISKHLGDVLNEINLTVAQMRRELEAMKLGATVGAFRGAVERLGGEDGDIPDTITRFNGLIDRMNELVRGIEGDPRSVIFGKSAPAIKP